MGYYTDYILTIKCDANHELLGDDDQFKDIVKLFTEESEDNDKLVSGYKFELDGNKLILGDAKWYDHEEDMVKVSSKYRDVLFMLYGDGEEEEDKWVAYFLNGLVQVCRAKITIEYEEFDASKLAPIKE